MQVTYKVVIHFPRESVKQPVIFNLAKEYNLTFNIMRASINPDEQGMMVLELSGEEADYERGSKYLKKLGIRMQPLVSDIRKNDERCVHCGACVGICPSAALFIERPSMKVNFEASRCVACGECVPCCPVKAMEIRF